MAGDFLDEAGDAEAGEVFLDVLDDGVRIGGGGEVGGACNGVELVDIVGEQAMVGEEFAELEHGGWVVVDVFEEDRLVEDGDAEALDFFEGGEDVGVEFDRVIAVDDEEDLFARTFENL